VHDNAEPRLPLGTVGWQRQDWLARYYPPDLPPEWRLAYYANDCGCTLLPAEAWCGADSDALEAAVHEAPARLLFFLQAPAAVTPRVRRALEIFPPGQTVLLTAGDDPAYPGWRQWRATGEDAWVDRGTGDCLVRWSVDTFDLRALRARADALERCVRALVLDGPGADPGRVPELRTLLELLGRG
jgi:hypothetical protein